ncbi:hypothetical protein [Pedobacter sp. NJ-S-72]
MDRFPNLTVLNELPPALAAAAADLINTGVADRPGSEATAVEVVKSPGPVKSHRAI